MMVKLNISRPVLSSWPEDTFQIYHRNADRLRRLAENVGTNSANFRERYRLIRRLGIAGDIARLKAEIVKTIDVLAFCELLICDSEFYERVGIRADCLTALFRGQELLSIQTLKSLIRLYFEKYTQLINASEFDYFCSLIRDQLVKRIKQRHNATKKNAFDKLCEASSLFFKKNAIKDAVEKAKNSFESFDAFLKAYSLEHYRTGDFIQQCQVLYYIETLKTIPLGENHPVLNQIVENKERRIVLSGVGPCVGHAALRILIDRNRNYVISQTWLNTILSIGHDPRMPKSSSYYQRWWGAIESKYASQVIAWLSRFDLNIFLDILEECSRDNVEMKRMFPARKLFIEGLLRLGFISQTRLILSKEATNFVNRKYNWRKPDWLKFAKVVKGNTTSFIYLNLRNQVHMMEGTHTCSLRMVGEMPLDSRITNYSCEEIEDYDCRKGFQYMNGPKYYDYLEQPHTTRWQINPIKYLRRHGLPVTPEQVMRNPNDYYRYC